MTETHTFGNRIIIRMTEMPCHTPHDILKSPLAARVVQRCLDHLVKHDSPLLGAARDLSPHPDGSGISPAAAGIIELLRLLVDFRPPVIREMVPHLAPLVETMQPLADFVDRLYDFWRDYARFLIYEGAADASRDRAIEGHLPFVRANDDLKNLVLDVYRRVDSNLRGCWPRVYHQVPAGASIGLLVDNIAWPCPYPALAEIPFVRLALLELPVALSTHRRRGDEAVIATATNPLAEAALDARQWYCLPLKVGTLGIHVFFHEEYLGLAACLVNLFELAGHADARRAPDGLVLFGLPAAPGATLFTDQAQELVVGAVGRAAETDSFETLERIILAVHDTITRRRGHLPVRGAMARIEMKDGTAANVLIIGAGGAETLEALRALAHARLRAMTVVFTEAGSLEMAEGGALARGTAVGAFAPLGELPPSYALGQIDRGIVLNPLTADARVVIPITTHEVIAAGYPVDICLCAQDGPDYAPLTDPERARRAFRAAAPSGDAADADAFIARLFTAGATLGALNTGDRDAAARALLGLISEEAAGYSPPL